MPVEAKELGGNLDKTSVVGQADIETGDPTSIGARIQQEVLQHIAHLRE